MDPTASSEELGRELASGQAELARLEKRDAELEAALAQVEHDARRCSDALERAGWRSGEAEARSAMLAEAATSIKRDREENRKLRRQLGRRLALLRERAAESNPDD